MLTLFLAVVSGAVGYLYGVHTASKVWNERIKRLMAALQKDLVKWQEKEKQKIRRDYNV